MVDELYAAAFDPFDNAGEATQATFDVCQAAWAALAEAGFDTQSSEKAATTTKAIHALGNALTAFALDPIPTERGAEFYRRGTEEEQAAARAYRVRLRVVA